MLRWDEEMNDGGSGEMQELFPVVVVGILVCSDMQAGDVECCV